MVSYIAPSEMKDASHQAYAFNPDTGPSVFMREERVGHSAPVGAGYAVADTPGGYVRVESRGVRA